MAGHGNSRHLTRLAASRYPRVHRKESQYLAKPTLGRHKLYRSVALLVVLRDKLGLAANANEARKAIKTGNIEVNGKIVKDDKFSIGFGDTIKIVPSKETFKIGVAKYADIRIEKVGEKQGERVLKVVGKYLAGKGRVMIRLYDGSTISGSKEVKVNDSVMVTEGKVKEVLKFAHGSKCLVVEGTHASESGVIKEIKKGTATSVASVKIEGKEGTFETPVENIMVVSA